MEIERSTANEMWLDTIHSIMGHGALVKSRGFECLELLNMHVTCPMRKPIVTNKRRDLGYKFLFAEAHWILSGDNRVDTIAPFSKMISQFSDDGITFAGAYGPKILDQLAYIIMVLSNDRGSRQAVMTIWRENPRKSKDIPCTISVQFIIRDNQLHCIDTMRSSDAWLGLPYDTFNFSMLSSFILLHLNLANGWNLALGDLHLNAGSLHLYKHNVVLAADCLTENEHRFRYGHLDPMIEFKGSPSKLIEHLYYVSRGMYDKLESQWVCCVARGDHDKRPAKTDEE